MSDVGFRVQDLGFRVWSFMFWKEISSAGRPPGRHCKTQKTLEKRSESQHLRAAPPSWPYNYNPTFTNIYIQNNFRSNLHFHIVIVLIVLLMTRGEAKEIERAFATVLFGGQTDFREFAELFDLGVPGQGSTLD